MVHRLLKIKRNKERVVVYGRKKDIYIYGPLLSVYGFTTKKTRSFLLSRHHKILFVSFHTSQYLLERAFS